MKFPERQENQNAKALLKLKAGESVVGVFRGEPRIFRQHWEIVGGQKRPIECGGVRGCERCKVDPKTVHRFQLNFVTKENAVYVAKIFEGSYSSQKDLEELNKDYPLETTVLKITRTGSGTDTRYSFVPKPNSTLSPAQEAELSKVHLNVLDPASAAGQQQAQHAADGPEQEEDVPF